MRAKLDASLNLREAASDEAAATHGKEIAARSEEALRQDAERDAAYVKALGELAEEGEPPLRAARLPPATAAALPTMAAVLARQSASWDSGRRRACARLTCAIFSARSRG